MYFYEYKSRPSLIIKEIRDINSLEFKQSLNLYQSSFPPNETRSIEKVITMLKDDENYHLFIAQDNSSVIGISLLYIFKKLKVALLDYMAVSTRYQRKGIGKALFEFTIKKCSCYVSGIIGLLIEVQKENGANLKENNRRKRRIKFYTQLGVKVLNGVNYLLPSQNEGNLEEMYLMMRPLVKIDSLSKVFVFRYISAIYSTIYKYENNDLLAKLFGTMPTIVHLRDLEG
jgi:GNAT superfamily N-acetyltransferase